MAGSVSADDIVVGPYKGVFITHPDGLPRQVRAVNCAVKNG
jgi:hypothetical protein